MDEHGRLVGVINEWFASRTQHQMTVKAHTGDHNEFVATGPFVGVEEHPSSPGVYRLLFDDSLTAGPGPDAVKYVAFGHELQDVYAEPARLVLDKGAQRIEILDRSVPVTAELLTADDVEWPEAVAPAVAAPMPAATAAASAPAAAVAAPAAAAPAAVPMAAPAQRTSEAPPFQLVARLYDNSLASGLVGPIEMRIADGVVSLVGRRLPSRAAGWLLVAGNLLLIPGAILALIGAATIVLDTQDAPSMPLLVLGMLLTLGGVVLRIAGGMKARDALPVEITFPLSQVRRAGVHYDTNLGCGLSVILSPIIGLGVMLGMGRRVVRMRAPVGFSGDTRSLVLRARSTADGVLIDRALRG